MTKGKQKPNNLYPKKKRKVQKITKVQEKTNNRRSSRGKSNVVDEIIYLEDDSTSTAVPAGRG